MLHFHVHSYMASRFMAVMVFFNCAVAASYGQITSCLTQLRDQSLNIIYVGVSNNVWLKNLPDGCEVKFNDKLTPPRDHYADDSFYIYKNFFLTVDKEGSYILRVFKNNKEIFKKEYQAKKINNPVVRLGVVKDTFASVEEILAYPAVVCNIPNCLLKCIFSINSYEIHLLKNMNQGVFVRREEGRDLNGAEFRKEIIDEIKKLKKGDHILIDGIKASRPDAITRSFTPIKVTIK